MTQRPSVGIGVCILQGNTMLLGKRKSDHGKHTRSRPGGHLEYGESREQCAIRETKEEAGVEINNIRLFHVTNDVFKDTQTHYISLLMKADYVSGNPVLLEPNKREERKWFTRDNLPTPLFLPIQQMIDDDINPFIK